MGSGPQGYWNFLMSKDKKWQKTSEFHSYLILQSIHKCWYDIEVTDIMLNRKTDE